MLLNKKHFKLLNIYFVFTNIQVLQLLSWISILSILSNEPANIKNTCIILEQLWFFSSCMLNTRNIPLGSPSIVSLHGQSSHLPSLNKSNNF